MGKCRAKGVPNELKLWGAIDGTLRPISVPKGNDNFQREFYNGHKREHGLLYLAVAAPDGMFAFISTPFPGRRHDMYALRSGPLYQQLRTLWQGVSPHHRSHIFGDPAYVDGMGIITNFGGDASMLTQEQRRFQVLLASLRTYVE